MLVIFNKDLQDSSQILVNNEIYTLYGKDKTLVVRYHNEECLTILLLDALQLMINSKFESKSVALINSGDNFTLVMSKKRRAKEQSKAANHEKKIPELILPHLNIITAKLFPSRLILRKRNKLLAKNPLFRMLSRKTPHPSWLPMSLKLLILLTTCNQATSAVSKSK